MVNPHPVRTYNFFDAIARFQKDFFSRIEPCFEHYIGDASFWCVEQRPADRAVRAATTPAVTTSPNSHACRTRSRAIGLARRDDPMRSGDVGRSVQPRRIYCTDAAVTANNAVHAPRHHGIGSAGNRCAELLL